jgi:N utilization substance protein B
VNFEIPIHSRVTLNEYLEVAKEYSTPKSIFINGILDNLVKN